MSTPIDDRSSLLRACLIGTRLKLTGNSSVDQVVTQLGARYRQDQDGTGPSMAVTHGVGGQTGVVLHSGQGKVGGVAGDLTMKAHAGGVEVSGSLGPDGLRRAFWLLVIVGVVACLIVSIVSGQPTPALIAVVLLAIGIANLVRARLDTRTMWTEIAAALSGSVSA